MASNSLEGSGFWLPSEFFDDAGSDYEFCFPTEFPHDFETQTGDNFKEKRRVMSTSPQSTLSHLWSFSGYGSPNGLPSPPATPLEAEKDAVGELIHRAVGQVARLKLSGGDLPGPAKNSGLPGPPKRPDPSVFHNIYSEEQIMKQRKQGSGMWQGESQMDHGWPVQRSPARIGRPGSRGILLGGAAVKRGCAGTGVFLPRRYENIISNDSVNAHFPDSCKRAGHSSAPYIPERNVHAPNKNFDRVNGYVPSQPQFQPEFNPGFVSGYDMLMARRNALIMQHRRSLILEKSSPVSHGMLLPQDWTY